MAKKIMAEVVNTKRYSQEKLAFFRENILSKIDETEISIKYHKSILRGNENATDDTSSSFNELEDGKLTLSKKEAQDFLTRDVKYIQLLKNAITRTQNGAYGVCCETGELISEERLLAVPHTTRSMNGKNIQSGHTPPLNAVFNRELPNYL